MKSLVGYDPTDHVQLSPLDYATAGAVSGVWTRSICQPFDVLKIRFQLQEEPIRRLPGSKYWGVSSAVASIVREEGLRGLWKGHVPAQALSVLYGTTQFMAFELLTKSVCVACPRLASHRAGKLASHSVCGGVAGCVATLASYPFDTVRTRLVAQGDPRIYTSVACAFGSMMRNEGPSSFFKGLVPTFMEIAPHAALQFGFYTFFTSLFSGDFSQRHNTAQTLACGSAAGLLAKVIVHPLDVVKKRLQVQGFTRARASFGGSTHYHGFSHCLVSIARCEGVSGFYKGTSPSLLKATLATALHFSFYEHICYLLRRKKSPS